MKEELKKLESFGIEWWGFDENVKDEDIPKICQKANDIMLRAEEEFDKYLDSIGYERCIGKIRVKEAKRKIDNQEV